MCYVFHFRVYAVVVFTAHTISRASNFAGDAAKAQTAAARIISLLNRTPLIDVTSEKGTKLVSAMYLTLIFVVSDVKNTRSITLHTTMLSLTDKLSNKL